MWVRAFQSLSHMKKIPGEVFVVLVVVFLKKKLRRGVPAIAQ